MPDVIAPAPKTTRDLSIFVAKQANGSRVLVPSVEMLFNDTLRCPTGIEVWSQDLVAGKGLDAHPVMRRPHSYQWRIAPDLRQTLSNGQPNPAYNPRGRSAAWQYDLNGGWAGEPTSLKNPYGVFLNGTEKSHGSKWGGFDATAAVDARGHLILRSLYLTSPWTGLQPNDVIQYLIVSGTGGTAQRAIGQVSVAADGNSIDFGPQDSTLPHVDTSGTVCWCVHKSGAGWALINDDSTVPPVYVAPDSNHLWSGYAKALTALYGKMNAAPVAYVQGGGKIVGFECIGANPRRDLAISKYDKSQPLVNEFQHGFYIEAGGQIVACRSHHHWGDGINGPGESVWCTTYSNGRENEYMGYDNKSALGNVYYDAHHNAGDIEATGPVSNVTIIAKVGNHGLAISSPVNGLHLELSSLQADIDAGVLPAGSLSTLISQGGGWQAGGKDWDVSLKTDLVQPKPHNADSFRIANVDDIHVHDSHRPTDGYVFNLDGCTNVSHDDETITGGALGSVAP